MRVNPGGVFLVSSGSGVAVGLASGGLVGEGGGGGGGGGWVAVGGVVGVANTPEVGDGVLVGTGVGVLVGVVSSSGSSGADRVSVVETITPVGLGVDEGSGTPGAGVEPGKTLAIPPA